MKLHIGVDSRTKLVQSAVATATNVHDSQVLEDLHGEETQVWGNSAYSGQTEVMHQTAPCVQDYTQHKASRHRALRAQERSRSRTLVQGTVPRAEEECQSTVAALALVNLVMAKWRLLQT